MFFNGLIKHGERMKDEREDIVRALHEGILAAWNVIQFDSEGMFNDSHAMAHAALASLESAGFKVERNA
jgi:hypothetical protein